MLGKIVSISDNGFRYQGAYRECGFDGFEVILDNGSKVLVGIDNQVDCCENWGYVQSVDTFDDFIGAEVLSVDVVDEALNVKTVVRIYEGGTMFVNINTSKGLFQLAVYNEHNGYYSHEAIVVVADNVVTREYL